MRRVLIVTGAVTVSMLLLGLPTVKAAEPVQIGELRLSADAASELRTRWYRQLVDRYGTNTWAPMRMELGDAELALMGLPPKDVLLAQRYSRPTRFGKNNEPQPAAGEGTAAFAGTGYFGIRPGGFLLLLNGNSIGWCSFAHVYGSPGAYSISTAGHCGKVGDIATVVGVVGNNTPVLIDIGKFSKSTGDGGIGKDWALISVDPRWQHLVSPTMAFWGGPQGMYTKTGDLAAVSWGKVGRPPSVSVTPDAGLAQQIVHYGHGLGIGAGGTPRSGTAIAWRPTYYMFFGAINLGDSGSASNTLTGDTVGALREAAGINTHIFLDALKPFDKGAGYLAGTRATLVTASLANGQLVGYPVPLPMLP